MNKYRYSGPVYLFDTLVMPNLILETEAVSIKKAKNNFEFRAKMMLGRKPNSRINLPGKIEMIEEGYSEPFKSKQLRMDI